MAKTNEAPQTGAEVVVTKGEAALLKYKKQILIALVAVVVIVAGVLLYDTYVATPNAEKSSTELALGQQYYEQGKFQEALKGDSAGFKGFEYVAKEYSGSDAGNLANLYAGLCCAQLDKWDDAIKYLEAYSPKDDALVTPAAYNALAGAYANKKQYDKAVETYKKAASMADAKAEGGVNLALSPTFLLSAGQILEEQNKNADALQVYQDIKKKYYAAQQNPAYQEALKRIEEVSQK